MYSVKEIFYSLQGEGARSGYPAIFIRFTGCNLWSGLEAQRAQAVCKFCDTDFVGTNGQNGGKFATAKMLVEHAINVKQAVVNIVSSHKRKHDKNNHHTKHFVVLTGGEPMLQVDRKLVDELHANNCDIAIETNGTLPIENEIDWICVSPKAGTDLVVTAGNELKLVYPQDENQPAQFEKLAFDYFYLQPKDDINKQSHTKAAIAYCLANPHWKLSIQQHKILNID